MGLCKFLEAFILLLLLHFDICLRKAAHQGQGSMCMSDSFPRKMKTVYFENCLNEKQPQQEHQSKERLAQWK